MKVLKTMMGAAALLALAAFAFTPPADARPSGFERNGRGHHHHGGPRLSIGFTAPVLPYGYVNLAIGGRPYYYHGGYFYRPVPAGYVVVAAPLGAAVATLPASAVTIQIGGFTYYQYADTYYQWLPARSAYVVVAPPAAAPAAPAVPAAPGAPGGYAPGQVLETLPAGYTAEIINGVQYYRYGSDYFIPTQRDGREVYVVVRF